MRLLLLCIGLLSFVGLHSEATSYGDDTFEVTLVGQNAALCAGQCTDYQIQITGGTGPYRLVFSIVGGSNFTIPNFGDDETVLRLCHDPSIGGAFLDSSQRPRVLRLPTSSLPYSIELMAATTDTPTCDGTILFGGPFTVSNGIMNSAFTADIPDFSCDTLILPDIDPSLPGVFYYTEPGGTGTSYAVGDTLTFADTQLPNGGTLSTLYIFDPSGNCGEAIIPFTIGRTPQINVPPDLTLCDTYFLENFSGGFITPQARYATSRDFEISSLLAVGDSLTTSSTVYLRDINLDINTGQTCEFLDSFDIEILPTPNTGLGQTILVCSGEPTVIPSLFDLLSGNPDTGGSWGGPMLPGIDFSNPTNIDLSDMTPGLIYVFTYNINVPGCGIFSTELVFEATGRPFPGTPTTVSLCADDAVDFLDLLGTPDPGGFWNQFFGSPVDVGDGSAVDLTTVPEGRYEFLHSVLWFGCPTQNALLEIDLTTGVHAGRDSSALVCWMETVDLNTFLSSDADANGTFLLDGFFPIADGIWNTSAVLLDPAESSRVIEVAYIIDGGPINCPNDTAFIEVRLLQNPFAGIPMSNPIQVCEDELINLNQLLTGEDNFGDYFIAADLSAPIDSNWIAASGNTEILYILPGTGACLADTASLNFVSVPAPTIDFQLERTAICDNECVIGTLSRSRPVEVALRVLDDLGNLFDFTVNQFDLDNIVFCPGGTFAASTRDTIFLGAATSFDFTVEDINDVQFNCSNAIDLSTLTTLTVNNSFEETLTGTVCVGGSTTINGVAYTGSTDLNLQSANGCDSIIHIVIDTLPQIEGNIALSFCADAGPQLILGQTFDRDTSELITFIGQAANGCDSVAMVDLSFSDVARGRLDTMICVGNSIDIDGEILVMEGTVEIDFAGSSAAGCDSLTLVTVSFHSQARGNLDTLICAGDSFTKGFDTFDENNLMGTSLLQGAGQFGCDSLLDVRVSIAPLTTEEIRDQICAGEEVLINGTIYDANRTTGTEVLQNEAGCDSLLLDIELELLMTSVTVSNQQICSGEVTGTFDIESVEGLDFPIEVFIDGVLITTINNLPALGLTAPAGTSQLQLVGPICSIESNLDLVVDNGNTNINVVASNTEINTFALSIQSENTLADVVWTSDFQVDCLTSLCDEATITIDADTEISVSVLLENGCTVTDNSLLTAIEIVRDSSFVIYSANIIDVASQDNSVFYVQSNVELLVRELSVYDRWGNLVFNNENFLSNDASEGWDGRYNSTVVEQGVYIYRITYTDETNREQQIVSSITLVR